MKHLKFQSMKDNNSSLVMLEIQKLLLPWNASNLLIIFLNSTIKDGYEPANVEGNKGRNNSFKWKAEFSNYEG